MLPSLSWSFPPFRLDTATGSLWRDDQLVPLPPKPLAVLATLVAQAGQVVTKEALLDAVWPDTAVTDGVLKGCIRQIRQVLGETAEAPQYIATVHRRGYRFLAPVTPVAASAEAPGPTGALAPPGPRLPTPCRAEAPPPVMVGREAELSQVHQWWAQACQGTRQVVFVTGEAGIGKTTLVDALVAQIMPTAPVWLGWGQCIEQHGAGEPYLPLLEALGRLGRGPDGSQLVAVLRQQAPSWLLQLPALVPEGDYEALQQRAGGVTRGRMLRELAEAVEALTAARPVVLVLEDLHWSDGATVDWLAYVARRREAARLLVLGTYRPTEALVQGHPVHTLTQDLQRHGQGHELVLGYFSETVVAAYLAQRFGTPQLPAALVRALHQRTTGNPLFLTAVVDTLVRQGQLREGGTSGAGGGDLAVRLGDVPDSLRQLMEQQLAQLAPTVQTLLEAASVAGQEFAVAAVAAAVGQAVEAVEDHCAALARQGLFLRAGGTDVWPDGTVAARYGFLHDLYRETLYARVPVGRRVRWHGQIGLRLEAGYGPQARERAAELAEHFVRGRDPARAVQHLGYAGERALQQSAHPQAVQHLTTALELLVTLPETPARAHQELALQTALGGALAALHGFGAPAVARPYARARALCRQLGETPQLFPVLVGLRTFYTLRGELRTACELGEQLLHMAQHAQKPELLCEAHYAFGVASFFAGAFAVASAHLADGLALCDLQQPRRQAALSVFHPGVAYGSYLALTLWHQGYPDQARRQSAATLALAHELAHPLSQAAAFCLAASLQQYCRDVTLVRTHTAAAIALCQTHGFAQYLAQAQWAHGWAVAAQGQAEVGQAQMYQGLAADQAAGAALTRPYALGRLAEIYAQHGQPEAGLPALVEGLAMIRGFGSHWYEAELHRLHGALLVQAGAQKATSEHGTPHAASGALPGEEAEAHLYRAWSIARHQEAKALELRAAMSLARLWQQQGKRAEARTLLAPIYNWFTEGFDTLDLQEARALLEALG